MFKAKICNDSKSYKIVPTKRKNLDLNKLQKHYKTIKSTPIAIIIEIDNTQIIIQRYGDLRFKNCLNKEFVEKTSKEIYENA